MFLNRFPESKIIFYSGTFRNRKFSIDLSSRNILNTARFSKEIINISKYGRFKTFISLLFPEKFSQFWIFIRGNIFFNDVNLYVGRYARAHNKRQSYFAIHILLRVIYFIIHAIVQTSVVCFTSYPKIITDIRTK